MWSECGSGWLGHGLQSGQLGQRPGRERDGETDRDTETERSGVRCFEGLAQQGRGGARFPEGLTGHLERQFLLLRAQGAVREATVLWKRRTVGFDCRPLWVESARDEAGERRRPSAEATATVGVALVSQEQPSASRLCFPGGN